MSGHIYVYEGKRYRTVDRKAEQGETIIIVNGYPDEEYVNGDVGIVVDDYTPYRVDFKGFNSLVDREEYHVLEPFESEEVTVDGTQASEQVIEMLANLARRVTSLERQLADTQRNLERQAEELENAKHRISNHATMFGAVEEMVNDLNDDVLILDERTQVVNAITKFYEEGR